MKRRAARQRMQQALRTTAKVARKRATPELREARETVTALADSLSGVSLQSAKRRIYVEQTPRYQGVKGVPGDELDPEMSARVEAAVARLLELNEHSKKGAVK